MQAVDEIVTPAHPAGDPGPVGLRGREPELTVIDQRLAALRAGRGGALLLDGPPGIGKTRLLEELRRRAERQGLRVIQAEAIDGQQSMPFAPLLAAVLGARPAIADAGRLRDLSRHSDTGYWLAHELGDLLRGAALRTPMVVILDGLQWADPGTVSVVRELTAAPHGPAVLWALAARREQATDAVRSLFSSVTGTMRLRELPAAVVPGVVEDVMHAPASPHLLAVAAAAGGHPFWLIQLLCGLREDGVLDGTPGRTAFGPAPLPRRITRLMHERLAALTPEARRVLRIAALLPSRFTCEQLAGLTNSHAAELIEPLCEAIRVGLLAADGPEMHFHPELLRRATRETLPGAVRGALEREVAELAAPVRRPSAGWESLTQAELTVVRVVAAGATNRDAAKRLFLSPHTVNAHVRNAFAKLGISSRVHLANLVRDNDR